MPKLERNWISDDSTLRISAQLTGDNLYLELDGHPVTFNVVSGPSGSFVLMDGDRILTGYAAATPDAIWVQLDGKTWVLKPEKRTPSGIAPQQPTSGDIVSPMTGTVRRVLTKPGQTVVAGAQLLIVEAMKMEYTVTAPVDGTVTEVRGAVGQSVDLGELLVRLEPSSNGAAS